MLSVRVRIYRNPWGDTVTTEGLAEILQGIGEKRAEHIERQIELGRYDEDDNNFALVILDSTAPIWVPTTETMLASIEIGPDPHHLLVNAIAKAFSHRDHGQLAGYGVYVDLLTSGDGEFCWGYSSQVDNLIGAGSGLTQEADACEVGHALVSFSFEIRMARKDWWVEKEQSTGRPSWFSQDARTPAGVYSLMAEREDAIYDSAS